MYSACPNTLKTQSPTDSLLLNLLEKRSNRAQWNLDEKNSKHVPRVEVYRDGCGDIINVKIGSWRILSRDVHRRIVEVRELACQRVAVRIEVENHNRLCSHCTIWELYDYKGHLLSMLQDLGDREIWLTTGFVSRRKSC